VDWSAGLLTYKGTTYNIAAGATDKKYIYWDPNYTTMFRDTNILDDVFACDGWVMCINDEGTAHPVYGLPVIHARLIQAATITADKYAELRNTYVYNGDDSLDSSHPFEVPFKIVSEMTSIVSIKISFRIMEYRAYSTAAASGGGATSGSGGGQSSSGIKGLPWSSINTNSAKADLSATAATESAEASISSGQDTESSKADISAFAQTENADCGGGVHKHDLPAGTGAFDGHVHEIPYTMFNGHSHDLAAGTTLFDGHIHVVDELIEHHHDVDDHTHSTPNHTHGITYGLHEESNSPTINFQINNGAGFGGVSSNYTTDQLDIDITEDITGTGWKAIKFNTNLRCRIAAIIECKLDITA